MTENNLFKMCNTCTYYNECKTLGIKLGFGICQAKEDSAPYNNVVNNDDYICSNYEPKEK